MEKIDIIYFSSLIFIWLFVIIFNTWYSLQPKKEEHRILPGNTIKFANIRIEDRCDLPTYKN